MSDLVERLRCGATTSRDWGTHLRKYQSLCDEAAARIAQLEAALREITGRNEYNPDMPENDMRAYFSGPLFAISEIARAALGEERT